MGRRPGEAFTQPNQTQPPPATPPVAPTLVSSVQASALLRTQKPKEKESKGTEDIVEGSLWRCI